MSLADELLPPEEPQRRVGRPVCVVREDDVFAAVHRIPILDVLAWLGIETAEQSGKTIVRCPRCGAFDDTSSAIIGNGVKCLHQTCSDSGPVSAPGLRTAIDLTMLVKGLAKPIDAVRELADAFNIPMVERRQERQGPRDEGDERQASVTEDEAPPASGAAPEAQASGASKPTIEILSMAQLLMPIYEQMKLAGTVERNGVPTGIGDLDEAIGGYRAGNVTILGAKRSFGKTSFSLLSIDTALASGCRVLVFAGEDSPEMYGRRFMARRSGVNATLLRDMRDKFTGVQLDKALQAVSAASNVPFFVNAIGLPVERIAEAVSATVVAGERWLVVVDYLQCLRARRRSSDRRLEITYIAQTLSGAIKRAGAAGLLLSQLRRTEKRRPEVEDLKESGDLEDAAEHILLGHREFTQQGPQKTERRFLIVGKNKDGCDDVPDIELSFSQVTASFAPKAATVPRDDYDDYGAPPLGRSWSPAEKAPAPPPPHWQDAAEREDLGGFAQEGFGGI